MSYSLSRRAIRDLDDMWDYGVERWSIDQAEEYQAPLRPQLEEWSTFPRAGRQHHELRGKPLSMLCGSHIIYYRIEGRRMRVLRILHQSQDGRRHL